MDAICNSFIPADVQEKYREQPKPKSSTPKPTSSTAKPNRKPGNTVNSGNIVNSKDTELSSSGRKSAEINGGKIERKGGKSGGRFRNQNGVQTPEKPRSSGEGGNDPINLKQEPKSSGNRIIEYFALCIYLLI